MGTLTQWNRNRPIRSLSFLLFFVMWIFGMAVFWLTLYDSRQRSRVITENGMVIITRTAIIGDQFRLAIKLNKCNNVQQLNNCFHELGPGTWGCLLSHKWLNISINLLEPQHVHVYCKFKDKLPVVSPQHKGKSWVFRQCGKTTPSQTRLFIRHVFVSNTAT